MVLVGAGTFALSSSIPITLAISGLVLIVALSYREVVSVYPQGGGVYNVAKANLGQTSALLGASSLIIDYTLTVAVSVAAAVAAITSAFPLLFPYRVPIGVVGILLIMWMNLRGVRSSGRLFSLPAYFFIGIVLFTIGYGLLRFQFGALPPISTPSEPSGSLQVVGLLVLLRAFSAGCTALTGVEAISNGVKAFKSPESITASRTILRLAVLLILILLGIGFLAYQIKAVPKLDETIVSQIARTLFGDTPLYYAFQIATFLILFLAANTSYAGFPRLVALQARDGYWPKQFSNLGSRLVFSKGILALSMVSILLLILSGGYVHALIPLYAVGVFFGFSLTQLGMIVHHTRSAKHKANKLLQNFKGLVINTIGFTVISTVFLVVLYSKFLDGAWLLIPMIGVLVFTMKRIRNHYTNIEKALSIEKTKFLNVPSQDIMALILVTKIDKRAVEGARVARGLNPARIGAFHVAFEEEAGEKLKTAWKALFPDIPIEIRLDEFREVIPTILDYFASIEPKWDGKIVAVVPMLVSHQLLTEFLHNRTARSIVEAIREDPKSRVEIYEVPVKVEGIRKQTV